MFNISVVSKEKITQARNLNGLLQQRPFQFELYIFATAQGTFFGIQKFELYKEIFWFMKYHTIVTGWLLVSSDKIIF